MRNARGIHPGVVTAAAVILAVMGAPAAHAEARGSAAAWPVSGQNIHNTRDAPDEHRLGPLNVSRLAPRWVLTTDGNVTATPAVVDGVVYVPDYGGSLWAIEAATGKVVWKHAISQYSGITGDVSRTTPAYWKGLLVIGEGVQTVESDKGALMLAVDAHTGSLRWRTKVDVASGAIITSSPVVDQGVVYVGTSSKDEGLPAIPTFRGSVMALNAGTGKILWKTYMVPRGYTGGAIWGSTPVVDHDTGLLYVTTGNNYSVPAGVCQVPTGHDCTPAPPDDHINGVVALNLETGHIVWSTQTMVGDLSTNYIKDKGPDWDFGQGPILLTTIRRGKSITLLGAGQKSGIYWALDPRTGKVVWKAQVGPGSHKGGMMWGSAADGQRIYVSIGNGDHQPVAVVSAAGKTSIATGGLWAALDAATGRILWQVADPQHAIDTGPLSVANGVVYAGSVAGSGDNMYALDAATGAIEWRFASGGAVASGPAIVDGTAYWGSGYYTKMAMKLPYEGKNNKLYAFAVPGN